MCFAHVRYCRLKQTFRMDMFLSPSDRLILTFKYQVCIDTKFVSFIGKWSLQPRVWDSTHSPVGASRYGDVYLRNRDTELRFLGSQEWEVQEGRLEGLPHRRDLKSDKVQENYIVLCTAPEKWEVLFPFWKTCCIHPEGRIFLSRSSSERFVSEMPVRLLFRVLYPILAETLKIKTLILPF
jgi:hypothetical protein